MRALFLLALVGLCAAYHETFDAGWESRWIASDDAKYAGNKLVVEEVTDLPGVQALKVPEKAKHYGMSAVLPEPVDPAEDLVLQYDLKLAKGLTCGGAYIKFLTADAEFTPAGLKDNTAYTVMFGPDKCGSTNKIHLILRHKNPQTGLIEEKHLKFPPAVPHDENTHVYTAILRASDNTYAVLVDGEEKKAGSLFEDFEPAINPPETIPDPEDKKPEDWVDEAKIVDPAATKPEDWDEDAPMMIPDEEAEKPEGWLDEEPALIDDAEATQPEDWDEEEDGEWEPPQVANPKCKDAPGCGPWARPEKRNPAYKGKWSAPMIDNPAYKGVWKPREIPNPDYYKDETPLASIGKVGGAAIEIWTMDDDYFFDNIVVSNSADEAAAIREETFAPKKEVEDRIVAEKKAKEDAEPKKTEEAEGGARSLLEEQAKAITETIFSLPVIRDNADKLAPVREFLDATPLAVFGLLAAPILLALPLLLGGSKKPVAKKDAAAAAKKKDVTSADDKPAAKKADGKGKAEAEEIQEESEGSGEEEKPGPRRRTARRD